MQTIYEYADTFIVKVNTMIGFYPLSLLLGKENQILAKPGLIFFFVVSDTSRICVKYLFPSGSGHQIHKLC